MAVIQNERDVRLQAASPRLVDVNLPSNIVVPQARGLALTAPTRDFLVGLSGQPSPASIEVTARTAFLVGAPTFTVTHGAANLSGTGNTRTLAYAGMSTDSVTIKASLVDNGVEYSDTITLTKVLDARVDADLSLPPTPTGFTATPAISHVIVEHAAPTYTAGHGHRHTALYGVEWAAGQPIPTFANARKLAEYTGTVYALPSEPATTWYLWAKWVTNDWVASAIAAGPVTATTGQSVAKLLEALNSKITETQLYSALGSRINLIDGADTLAGSVNARIKTETDARTTAISNEQTVRANADSSLASDISTVSATANAKNRSYSQAAAPTGTLVVGDIWLDSDDSNKAYRWNGSAWAAADDARIAVNAAAIATEQTARANADSSLASDITTVSATANSKNRTYSQAAAPTGTFVAGDLWFDSDDNNKAYRYSGTAWAAADDARIAANAAAIVTEQTARADGDAANAASISTVSATANAKNRTYRQAAAPTGTLVSGDVWFDSDDNNKAYRYSGTAWEATDDARIAANAAAIQTEQTARADGDAANAASITTLQSTVNGNTAAIQTETSTRATQTGELYAQYTVKTDVAGLVSGYGLASTANNAAPSSMFGVRANAFFVAPPATASATAPTADLYDGYVWLDTSVTPNVTRYRSGGLWVTTPPVLPFVVQATPTTVGGQTVPAGVYIKDLFVMNGTMTGAKIALLAVDDGHIVNLSVAKLTAGSLAVGQYIQSSNYIAGSAGWRIDASGTFEANSGTFRGALAAATGTFAGTLTAGAVNAVNTINIAGNAVTVPASAFTSGSVGIGTSYVTVQSINFTTTGLPLFVHASCFVDFSLPGATSTIELYGRVLRGGVQLFEGRLFRSTGGTLTSPDYISWSQGIGDTPAAGTYLYEVQLRSTNGAATFNARERSLFLLETKR